MNDQLAKQLAHSVTDFYAVHGAAFARTRGMVWHEERVVANRILPGMKVVDIGAGNGRFARLLIEGSDYTGIEPSDALRGSSPPDVRLYPGAFPHLPLENNLADVTTCFAVIQHIPGEEHRRNAVDELIRITKPGGLIAATSWHHALQDKRIEWIKNGDPGDAWIPWKAEHADGKRYVHFMQPNEWENLWRHPSLSIERIGMYGEHDWTSDEASARNWFVLATKSNIV